MSTIPCTNCSLHNLWKYPGDNRMNRVKVKYICRLVSDKTFKGTGDRLCVYIYHVLHHQTFNVYKITVLQWFTAITFDYLNILFKKFKRVEKAFSTPTLMEFYDFFKFYLQKRSPVTTCD